MPRLFSFYVISPARLAEESSDVVARYGAQWAQIEGKAVRTLDAFDAIDRVLGEPVIRERIGTFTPEETLELHDGLAAASSEALAKIDADDAMNSAYWALRDTAEEAVRRGACMVIECEG